MQISGGLLDWLSDAVAVKVISTATASLLPRIERGAFLELALLPAEHHLYLHDKRRRVAARVTCDQTSQAMHVGVLHDRTMFMSCCVMLGCQGMELP